MLGTCMHTLVHTGMRRGPPTGGGHGCCGDRLQIDALFAAADDSQVGHAARGPCSRRTGAAFTSALWVNLCSVTSPVLW